MKTTLIILGSIIVIGYLLWLGFSYWIGNNIGGGGMQQFSPDTVHAGEQTDITVVVTATGGGGNVQGRFTDLSLHYRLVGEDTYKSLQPQSIALPENFQAVQSEAYRFTIPAYQKGTTGEIEYYTKITFDGHGSRQEGVKKIKILNEISTTQRERFVFREEAYSFCSGGQPPILCKGGMSMGCDLTNKRWGCYSAQKSEDTQTNLNAQKNVKTDSENF